MRTFCFASLSFLLIISFAGSRRVFFSSANNWHQKMSSEWREKKTKLFFSGWLFAMTEENFFLRFLCLFVSIGMHMMMLRSGTRNQSQQIMLNYKEIRLQCFVCVPKVCSSVGLSQARTSNSCCAISCFKVKVWEMSACGMGEKEQNLLIWMSQELFASNDSLTFPGWNIFIFSQQFPRSFYEGFVLMLSQSSAVSLTRCHISS